MTRNPFVSSPWSWTLGIAFAALYVASIHPLIGVRPLSTENYHFSQIAQFLRHDWRAIPELATVHSYHLVIAAMMSVVHARTLDAARLIATGLQFTPVMSSRLSLSLAC